MDHKKVQEVAQKHIQKLQNIKTKQESAIEEFFQAADEAQAQEIKTNLNE